MLIQENKLSLENIQDVTIIQKIKKYLSGYFFEKTNIKKIVGENYPIISIIVGYMLVALSIGPYHNGDTAWEYDAVSGVMKYGLPYANGFNLIDQPPLGFYIQAVFFLAFGSSINNGTFLVTLFGLGSVLLVYGIGKNAYNKTIGLLAATLFAFSPWHLILSRTFLIDAQCLFFSLSSLFVGIIAIRRDSLRLLFISGIIFAISFNTKLYAIFILIPLLLFFLFNKSINLKHTISWLGTFSLPVLFFSFLWYQIVSGLGVNSVISHTDFIVNNPSVVIPSMFFVSNFLINYGLGWFFIDAAILSLLIYLVRRRLLPKSMVFDVTCLAVIICVIGVDTYLGAGLNLKAPYLNAIKYDYHALPFLSFLAASLIGKSISLFDLRKTEKKLSKLTVSLVASIGLVLVSAAILYNMYYVHLFSTWNYLIFRVEPDVNMGYSLFNSAPISENSNLMCIQYVGFAFLISGLLWAGRHKIARLIKI